MTCAICYVSSSYMAVCLEAACRVALSLIASYDESPCAPPHLNSCVARSARLEAPRALGPLGCRMARRQLAVRPIAAPGYSGSEQARAPVPEGMGKQYR